VKKIWRIEKSERFKALINNQIECSNEGDYLTIGSRTRTLDQNAIFHAMCGDVARQHLYLGRRLSLQQWKVLYISGHAIATGLGADMLPGLEGEYVNLRESSAQMGVKRMASLIEYVTAYCAENEIKLTTNRVEA
jgi:hypothetical protein